MHDAAVVFHTEVLEGNHTGRLLLACGVTCGVAVGATVAATRRIAFRFAGNLKLRFLAIIAADVFVFGLELCAAFGASDVCECGSFTDNHRFLLS
jgi:hypothetical protein